MSSSFKYIVRMFGTDVDGNKPVLQGLTSIKGLGLNMAMCMVRALDLDPKRKIGDLSDEEVVRITRAMEDPASVGIPAWKLNRRKDYETGKDIQLNTSQLIVVQREDISRLKKIRSYRGIRHERGLKVRGQRTRSTGRSGSVVGVKKKKGGGIMRETGPAAKEE